MNLRALLTVATTAAVLALSAVSPAAHAGTYPGCEERSAPTSVTYRPVFVGFQMETKLSECDTADLIDKLRGGAASAGMCAALAEGYRNHPQVQLRTPKSKWVLIGTLVCAAVAAGWSDSAFRFSSADKAKCGVVISNTVGIRLAGGSGSFWSIFSAGEWVEGQPCAPGVKSDVDNPGPRSPLPETSDDDGRLADRLDPTVLEGTWQVTSGQNKVAYSEVEITEDGKVRATKVASSGCGVVDRGEVMGVFETGGAHRLAGCGGGDFTYVRSWDMADWSTLKISTGATLSRIG